MPDSQPAVINVKDEKNQELIRQLNFIFKDIYRWVDYMRGIRNNTFDPVSMGGHDHQSDDAGGDYDWADFEAADVVYLQALRAAILVSNLLDKSAAETVTGAWTFNDLIIDITDGVVTFQKEDGTGQPAYFQLFPGAASNQGPIIGLYTCDDHDSNIPWYGLQVRYDDLYLGPSTDQDALKYDGGNNQWEFSKPVKFSDDIIGGGAKAYFFGTM